MNSFLLNFTVELLDNSSLSCLFDFNVFFKKKENETGVC